MSCILFGIKFAHDLAEHDMEFAHDLAEYDMEFGHDLAEYDTEFGHDLAEYDMEFGHDLVEYDVKFGHDLAEYDMEFRHDLAEYYYVNLWLKLEIEIKVKKAFYRIQYARFEAEDVWTTKLHHDWAIPLEQLANRSHRRDTQHFNLQEHTQNISIQAVSPGRIETLHQLHERLCDGLAVKKRYTNVLYITLHIVIFRCL